MTTPSKAFGSEKAAKPHLTQGKGGVAGEVDDLRKDVEDGFLTTEARTGFPELDWIDGTGPSASGGTVILKGRNLLQGQTFDSITFGTGTSELVFTAMRPGDSGYKILLQDTGSLTVGFSGDTLTVTYDGGTSTADAIATAVNAEATNVGVIRCVSGGTGTTIVASTDQTNGDAMTGGTGDHPGNNLEVAGAACAPLHATGTSPAATWADGEISITVPSLTGRAAADVVALRVQSNGIWTQALSDALVA